MKIIEPSVELMRDFDGAEVMKFLELCGRTCYQSWKNTTDDSAIVFVRNLIKRGHESVLEHFSATFKIICDRGVMAELTRHRLASFSIESTRFCAYDTDKFDGELTFIKPCFWSESEKVSGYDIVFDDEDETVFAKKLNKFQMWKEIMSGIDKAYKILREEGATPEQARSILPNSLKTEIVMTANLRELRHILKLRTAKDAHPQMRQVANMILDILKQKLPVIFEDIGNE